jgi:hypothetical protein
MIQAAKITDVRIDQLLPFQGSRTSLPRSHRLRERNRLFKANAAPVGRPSQWAFICPHHEGRTPTHGYAGTREGAMAAPDKAMNNATKVSETNLTWKWTTECSPQSVPGWCS